MDIVKAVVGVAAAGAVGYAGYSYWKSREEPGPGPGPTPGTAVLSGTVVDQYQQSNTLGGVTVTVAPDSGGSKSTTTGADGTYVISDLPLGLCTITF